MQAVYNFTIFADYFQFIVIDENCNTDFSTIWTDEAVSQMLAVGPGAICPGTLRTVDVPVQVVVSETAPSLQIDQIDHAIEASLSVTSGKLMVCSCTAYGPDAPRIMVAPGEYQVLFVATGIDSIQTEWEPADDQYSVYLWPGPARKTKLIKHWNSNA